MSPQGGGPQRREVRLLSPFLPVCVYSDTQATAVRLLSSKRWLLTLLAGRAGHRPGGFPAK